MALSGIFYGTTANPRLKPQISWSGVQNIAGNYTDITASLQYTRSNAGYTSGGTWEGSLTVDGETVKKKLYMEIVYGSVTTVITHTFRVYHREDGTKTVTISATGGIVTPAEASLKSTNISATITLDTIPRASQVSATDGNIGSCVTVVVSKADRSLSHSLSFQFGELSGYIDPSGAITQQETVFDQTVVNFALPESFYLEIPDAKSGVCTLTCTTYHGQTAVGSAVCSFHATAPEAVCRPLAEFSARDVYTITQEYTGDDQIAVLNASIMRCVLSAQGQKGASITEKSIAGQKITGDTLTLEPIRQNPIPYYVVDSRGYRTEGQLQLQEIPYIPVTAQGSVRRASPTADSGVLTLFGQCYPGTLGQVPNTLSLLATVSGKEYRQSIPIGEDGSYRTEITLTGLDYTQSYLLEVLVSDCITDCRLNLEIPRGVPVFDWGEGDFRFHVPVYVPRLFVDGREINA